MLHLHFISKPEDKKPFLEQYDPTRETWLVSDLRSKFDLQKKVLSERGFIEEEALLRASELWQALITRRDPEMRWVTSDFLNVVVQSLWKENSQGDFEDWQKTPGAAQAALNYLQQLMPVHGHPEGKRTVEAWLKSNHESELRWGQWLRKTNELWHFFQKEKVLTSLWASGALLQSMTEELSLDNHWQRPLWVDLGVRLNVVEAELFYELSRSTDVHILWPLFQPLKADEVSSKEKMIFEVLRYAPSKEDKMLEVSEKNYENMSFPRWTTMLAEVKGAVAQVRAWADRGIDLQKIAILAPDIEEYWPTLATFLQEEGLPAQKKQLVRRTSFLDVLSWVSRLRIELKEVSTADLETSLFQTQNSSPMEYEKFRSLFARIYGEEDLQRASLVEDFYQRRMQPHAKLKADEFFAWALTFWRSQDVQHLEVIGRKWFQEVPTSFELEAQNWLRYLERLLAKDEVEVVEDESDGLVCLSLSSAELPEIENMILLGMHEQALRQQRKTALSRFDVEALAQETGFLLDSPESQDIELEARWLLKHPRTEVIISFAATDFSGVPLAPSLLWLEGRKSTQGQDSDFEKVLEPKKTLWDEWQSLVSVGEELEKGPERWWKGFREVIRQGLKVDSGDIENEENTFGGDLLPSLSASKIERFLKCPFVFASESLLKLSDLPDIDLDIDRMTRGRLMHALFENLLKRDLMKELSEEELDAVVEKSREQTDFLVGDERLWQGLKKRYLQLGRRFYEFERSWREKFPQTKTQACEQKFAGVIDPTSGDLKSSEDEGIVFRGVIDRIDTDGENLALIDYKSSVSTLHNANAWLEHNELQLALYIEAAEQGLIEGLPEGQEVISAVYYHGATCDRDKGFKLEEKTGSLYEIEKRKTNKLNSEQKEKLLSALREKLKETTQKMKRGEFSPEPFEYSVCETCRWRKLCRAPHLM